MKQGGMNFYRDMLRKRKINFHVFCGGGNERLGDNVSDQKTIKLKHSILTTAALIATHVHVFFSSN